MGETARAFSSRATVEPVGSSGMVASLNKASAADNFFSPVSILQAAGARVAHFSPQDLTKTSPSS